MTDVSCPGPTTRFTVHLTGDEGQDVGGQILSNMVAVYGAPPLCLLYECSGNDERLPHF